MSPFISHSCSFHCKALSCPCLPNVLLACLFPFYSHFQCPCLCPAHKYENMHISVKYAFYRKGIMITLSIFYVVLTVFTNISIMCEKKMRIRVSSLSCELFLCCQLNHVNRKCESSARTPALLLKTMMW